MRLQRRMAAEILKCGENRVWMDPARLDEIRQAITKTDIRRLIKQGLIKKLPEEGVSRGRARKIAVQKKKGRRKGRGSRKGVSKTESKEQWIKRIRAIRRYLKKLREDEKITKETYKDLYRKAKGGFFKSNNHVKIYLQRNELFVKKGEK